MQDDIGIADHQINSPNPYYVSAASHAPPQRARYGLWLPIGPMSPYWRSSAGSSIEVDLLVPHTLTNVTTEGCSILFADSWITSANIYVSDDKVNWLLVGVRHHEQQLLYTGHVAIGGGGGGQAYSRLSTTQGHITDCKLDSVVYAGVCVVHVAI